RDRLLPADEPGGRSVREPLAHLGEGFADLPDLGQRPVVLSLRRHGASIPRTSAAGLRPAVGMAVYLGPVPASPPIELVVFDCDGVLVDSERLAVAVESRLLGELGWALTEDEVFDRFVG